MRIICPQCRTIYQLSSVDPDAILVCHRCGAEFGMGEAPDGAEQIDTPPFSESETKDLFAGMGFDETMEEHRTEPTAEAEAGASEPRTQHADEEAGHEVQSEATETDTHDAIPDNISLNDLPDDYLTRPAPSGRDLSLDDRADDSALASPRAGDDINPPIIPPRDIWQEPEPSLSDNTDSTTRPEDLQGPESVYFDENEPAPPPPPRRKARILPWLIIVLLGLFGAGLWMNYSAWMDNPWLRSVLINAGVHLQIRNKDWHIDPASVSAEWIKRENGDAVLIIHGDIHNRLQTDVAPPRIHFTLYAKDNPRLVILQRDLIITRPPLMESIRQSSYVAPLPDNTPVSALGKRDFVLVLDHLPDNAGNFTLSPKAR